MFWLDEFEWSKEAGVVWVSIVLSRKTPFVSSPSSDLLHAGVLYLNPSFISSYRHLHFIINNLQGDC